MKQSNVLVIIPAYNEAENLPSVVDDLAKYCPDYDYLIINDGSKDNTAELCKDSGFSHVNLFINLGFSGAVQTGYLEALGSGYDYAVQFDGDGQHPAQSIREMVSLLESSEYDYVLGSRFVSTKKEFSFRMVGSRFISLLVLLRTGKRISDPTSGFRAVNRKVLTKMATSLNFIAEPDTLTRAILNGFRVKEMQVDMRERIAGVSHFSNPLNSIKYMTRITVSILFLQGRVW